MTAATRQARAAAVIVQPRQHGEAFALPSGASVFGVFNPFDPRAAADSEVGRSMRLSQQYNATIALTDAGAAVLAEDDVLTDERGDAWRITRIDPDGYGMTTVMLAPNDAHLAAQTPASRWR